MTAAPSLRNSPRPAQPRYLPLALKSGNYSEVYADFVASYRQTGEPIEVNFRELVPSAAGADRATHLIHSYPAKLLASIPAFFTHCDQLSRSNDVVLDPFCGTGTVLLEALLAGRHAGGADSNPLARLIARVKLTPLDVPRTRKIAQRILEVNTPVTARPFSPVVDAAHWYAPKTIAALGRLLSRIQGVRDEPTRDFLLVCFSACLKRLSFADPRLSVPVRRKPGDLGVGAGASEVRAAFASAVELNLKRMASLRVPEGSRFVGLATDARTLGRRCHGWALPKAHLVITSPPYLSAQKYIRASSLSLGWLGLAPGDQLRPLEDQCIGREHLNEGDRSKKTVIPESARAPVARIKKQDETRAAITSIYLEEMLAALRATVERLRAGGHMVLVMGNNTVCGMPFQTSDHVAGMLGSLGMVRELELVDHIRSRGLMTKRNVTAGIITQEHIHVFKKASARR